MALVTCAECGNDVSDRAAACPRCGNPLTPNLSTAVPAPSISGSESEIQPEIADRFSFPRRQLLIVAAALAVLLIATVGFVTLRGSEHTITGTFTVYDEFNGCELSDGYSDISEGTEVVVADDTGKTLGVGELGEPVEAETDEDGDIFGCEFPFEVTGVGDSPIYAVSVADRGTSRSKKTELEENNWEVDLSLGL